MLKGLLDSVSDEIREQCNLKPRLEGSPTDGWVLVDFGDIILHLFSPERRKYYKLEELWSQGKKLIHLQ